MPSFDLEVSTKVVRDARVKQIEGIFDVAPSQRSVTTWHVDLPIEDRPWNVGLIVGPSGCGKTTIARKAFGDRVLSGFEWDADKAVVSQFGDMPIKDVSAALSAVGFSSPPSWLRPFHVLSMGEQFRVTLAKAIATENELFVIDEFTSVVDRTVAQIGSCAVAKAIRRANKQMVAVACHYDIIDWLQPDWVYEPVGNSFTWRELRRRPAIEIEVKRVNCSAWKLFKHHHYLDASLNKAAACYVGFVRGIPAVFAAVLSQPHPKSPSWRGHRTVCLPDFQGVGIGNAFSEYVASLYASSKPYRSTTSSPSMIYHRAKSRSWKMVTPPTSKSSDRDAGGVRRKASFLWVGPVRADDAVRFGVTGAGRRSASRARPAL